MTDPTTMADSRDLSHIHPGRGLGWMNLGASIHGILSRLKAQPHLYPQLQLSYSEEDPILGPIILNLPKNDIRLRFDGPDQRLRLIEILGWSQTTFMYKSVEVIRRHPISEKSTGARPLHTESTITGPSFRHIYNRLFGPAYAGEYLPPRSGQTVGTYVLSYPGLAIRFPLKHASYSDRADFVSLLSSAAAPATSMAVFSGASWPEARDTLYVKSPPLPRSLALGSKNAEAVPDEIENIIIHTGGRIELIRRSTPSFVITLSVTTTQDVVAELGPPDAIFRKPVSRISIHAASQPDSRGLASESPNLQPSSVDTNRSSNTSLASALEDDSGVDSHNQSDTDATSANPDCFYNYFHHGFDILISHPTTRSPVFPGVEATNSPSQPISANMGLENKLTATKIFLHGNIPGSYSFNRHRRSRWVIPLPASFTPPAPVPVRALADLDIQDASRSTMPPQPKSKSSKATSKPRSIASSPQVQPTASKVDANLLDDDLPPRSGTVLKSPPTQSPSEAQPQQSQNHLLTSEMRFPEISQTLNVLWSSASSSASSSSTYPGTRNRRASMTNYTSKGMVLNRGWTTDLSSPESSIELLGGTMTMDETSVSTPMSPVSSIVGPMTRRPLKSALGTTNEGATRGAGGGNTQLFGFPGMLFEVLDHGEISCVSIY